jgi:hypothetical protein
MGLDLMDDVGLIFDNMKKTLSSPMMSVSLPVVRKMGHAYLEWPEEVLYTESEVRKIHSAFYHPSADKLFNLIRRANPSVATSSLLNTIKHISKACLACQEYSIQHTRFKVAIPEIGIVFNRQVAMDLMFMKVGTGRSRPLLHVVDVETNVSSA